MKCIKCGKYVTVSPTLWEQFTSGNWPAQVSQNPAWSTTPCWHEVAGGPLLALTTAELHALLTRAYCASQTPHVTTLDWMESGEEYLRLSGPNAAAVKAWAEQMDAPKDIHGVYACPNCGTEHEYLWREKPTED